MIAPPVHYPPQEDSSNAATPGSPHRGSPAEQPQEHLGRDPARSPHRRHRRLRLGQVIAAFDTLFAEGQWRYIESLSTYARMFLERIDRPDVDRIEQIRPAVALAQKNPVRTARSTVGTATEIYDYLRLLYAKVGRVYCAACGAPAASHSAATIADALLAEHAGARALVTFPLPVVAGAAPAE